MQIKEAYRTYGAIDFSCNVTLLILMLNFLRLMIHMIAVTGIEFKFFCDSKIDFH